MTRTEFNYLCLSYCIDQACAMENVNVLRALFTNDRALLVETLENEF